MEYFIYGLVNGTAYVSNRSMMEDVVYGSVDSNADGTNESTVEGFGDG